MRRDLKHGVLLAAVAALVFFTCLGATHLWDDDETFFAQVAREMFDRGDLVVPWFNGELFAHKPPFMYWMMIGAYRAFGVSEFAARLPSALFALATVLLVWRMGQTLYSPRAGLWAGLALATCLNFTVIARAATADAELTFFCTLALFVFVRGTSVRRIGVPADAGNAACVPAERAWHDGQIVLHPSRATWGVIYAVLGVAVLVKGPLGVALPTVVVGLFLLAIRENKVAVAGGVSAAGVTGPAGRLRRIAQSGCVLLGRLFNPSHVARTVWSMHPVMAVAVVLAVAGPWFAAVSLRTGGEFLEGFFGVHHFSRFMKPMENHSGPVVYYPIAICVGFFPWSLLFAPVIMDLIQRVRARHAWRPGDVLCISWVAAWVGIFSLASTKFPHYVVPAYPALALATGAFATRWVEDDRLYKPLARRCLWATLALVGVAILVAVPIVAHKYQVADASLGLVGAPLLIGALSGFVLTERGRVERAMAALCGTAVLFLVALFGYAAVVVDRHQNSELFAAAIRAIAPGGDARLVTWRYFRPGLVYYFNGRVDVVRQRPDAARSLEHTGSPVFLLTREDEYRALAESLPRDVKVLARSPWFLQSDRTLVLVGRETALAASDRQSPQR